MKYSKEFNRAAPFEEELAEVILLGPFNRADRRFLKRLLAVMKELATEPTPGKNADVIPINPNMYFESSE